MVGIRPRWEIPTTNEASSQHLKKITDTSLIPLHHSYLANPLNALKGFSTMTTNRRHRLHIATGALSVLTMIVGVPVAANAAGNDTSASTVINTTKAAMAKESGVHVQVTSKTSSYSTKVVADIGATYGMETITEGSDEVTIKVTPTYAYLSGNAAGLTTLMGLNATEQKKLGAQTLSMKSGTNPYKSLKSSVTLPVLASLLPSVKGTSLSTVAIGGGKYYKLSWTNAASSSTSKSQAAITLSQGASVLPLRETDTSSSGASTTTFSKWGERVSFPAPSASRIISYSKVFG